jgi:hypothetical protein
MSPKSLRKPMMHEMLTVNLQQLKLLSRHLTERLQQSKKRTMNPMKVGAAMTMIMMMTMTMAMAKTAAKTRKTWQKHLGKPDT